MRNLFDAVIVGAGPAGLAAATVLARHDLRVLVCDRRQLPIDKPCGEGLLPTGLGHLRTLDAFRHLNPDETQPFKGIRVHSAGGRTACADFAEGPGLGIRRLNLSRALARSARARATVEVEESAVRGISPTPSHMEVQLARGVVQTRLVIGADGLNSKVRRWANLEAGRGGFHRLGARRHFHVTPWSEHVEVSHGPGIEAYVTPCGPDQVGVAFLWDAKRFRGARGGPALFPSLLRAFPELNDRLARTTPASPTLSTGPLHRLARRRACDGVLLIGDAGGYLDACTGEGLSLAFAQALALERTIVPLLQRHGVPSTREMQCYERACRDITQPYLRATRILLYLGRHPALLERFIQAVAAAPDILQHVFSAQMGEASFWPGWSKLLRLLWGMSRAGQRTFAARRGMA